MGKAAALNPDRVQEVENVEELSKMSCGHVAEIARLQSPRLSQSVHREECTQCFDNQVRLTDSVALEAPADGICRTALLESTYVWFVSMEDVSTRAGITHAYTPRKLVTHSH